MIVGAAHIREATLADFDQIAFLVRNAHRAAGDTGLCYEAPVVFQRVQQTWLSDGKIFIVEQDGAILACGAIAPANFARWTWALSLGATRPDLQGTGLGYQLVVKRLEIAMAERAGAVLVSSRNEARWRRYGFERAFTNTVTGAHLMVLQPDYGRS